MKQLKFDLHGVTVKDDGLWTIDKLFDNNDFEFIKQEVLACPENLYTPSPAHPTNRFELTWHLDGILETLWNAFNSYAPTISNITKTPLKFGQVRVWQDRPGFMIPFHEDDQVSVAHIQIYIDGPSDDIGTTWYTTQGRHSCPFIPNSGYITLCSKRLPHGMLKPVTGRTRYSLYATFAKAN